jgi:hypothetical protein
LEVAQRRVDRYVAAACVLLTAWAAPAIAMAARLPWQVLPLVSVLAAAVTAGGFWKAGWLGWRPRLRRIAWQVDGGWLLTDFSGATRHAELRGDSRLGAGCAWLRWDMQPGAGSVWARTCTLLLVPGDVSAPDLRRLQVRLRIDGIGGVETARRIHEFAVAPTHV